MNLTVLRKARSPLRPGDVFAYRIRGHEFGFGRVIRTDCVIVAREYSGESFLGYGPAVSDLILVYIYNSFSKVKCGPLALNPRDLLIPPQLINRLPWSHGYFETIEHRSLMQADVIPHSFYNSVEEKYVDEVGRPTKKKSARRNVLGFGSFRTIDAQISRALGIEPAPDTVPPPRSARKRRGA